MRILWREAGIAALVCGTLSACASPAYPISEDQPSGPAQRAMARPAYPVSEAEVRPAPAALAPAPPAPSDAAEPSSPPLSAPVAPVDSQPLPAPGPSASSLGGPRSDGARLQYASLSTQGATPATAPDSTATSTAPVSSSLPPPAPAAAPPPAAANPAAESAMTPQMVVHDQQTPSPPAARTPPVREASATPADQLLNAPSGPRAGDVVDAPAGIFQNYEVQRGDHLDALARAFATTRDVLIDANHIRSPYTIHPGQIMKVPVAKAYVARSGDTLFGVARRFSVGVDELAQLNHLSSRAPLRAGQEIGLPSSMRDRGPGSESEYASASGGYRTQTETPLHGYAPSSTVQVRPYGQLPAGPTPRPSYGYVAPPPPAAAAAAMSDSDIAQAAHGRFVWPVRGDMLVRFGPQGVGRRNDGIDIRASQGTVVKAAAGGEVVYAGNQVPGFGNLVLIKHADGWVTAYAHLDQVDVQMKQQVAQGQSVGTVGASGGATEPELHFEVRYAPTPADKARPVDPVLVLPLG